MSVLCFIFFGTLSIVALVCCFRAIKIMVKAVNHLFDKIEDKFQ